jgi:magnesium-transporting ATPase (P-type)
LVVERAFEDRRLQELNRTDFPPGFKFDLDVQDGYMGNVKGDTGNFPLTGFTLVGFLALIDIPRSTVKPAIELCTKANIRVYMVTGDHPETAHAIAKQLGLVSSPTLGEVQAGDYDEQKFPHLKELADKARAKQAKGQPTMDAAAKAVNEAEAALKAAKASGDKQKEEAAKNELQAKKAAKMQEDSLWILTEEDYLPKEFLDYLQECKEERAKALEEYKKQPNLTADDIKAREAERQKNADTRPIASKKFDLPLQAIVVTGTRLETFEPEDWKTVLQHKEVVFARTMPQQKQDIVTYLNRQAT